MIIEVAFQAQLQNLTATADTDYSLWKATKQQKQPTQCISPFRIEDAFAVKPNELPQNVALKKKSTMR
jgi:hypothetical protein